jgi:PhnB protein
MFWGDRVGRIRDPFGNVWWLQTHTDISFEEIQARMKNPSMARGMEYVKDSLNEELSNRT